MARNQQLALVLARGLLQHARASRMALARAGAESICLKRNTEGKRTGVESCRWLWVPVSYIHIILHTNRIKDKELGI